MKRDYNKLYNIYLNRYKERKTKNLYPLTQQYSKQKFITQYEAVYGAKKADKEFRVNIIRDIVKGQENTFKSRLSARAIQKALLNKGIKITQRDIRLNSNIPELQEFYDSISNTYTNLRKDGANTYDAKKYISRIFFGSP